MTSPVFLKSTINQRFINNMRKNMLLTTDDDKDRIIQDFKDLIMQMDLNTSDEINNKLADITKRIRRLFDADRDITRG